MRTPGSGLRIDSPAFPLLLAHISYWDIASANGSVLGTTIVCANLANEPSYQGLPVKVLDGDAAGQVRAIAVHVAGANTLTVANPFTDNAGAVVQIVAGTRFVILSIAGGGGAPPPLVPSIGLWMFGECDAGMAASLDTLVLTNLAGFPDDIFNDEFWIQIIHNADAPGTAPERQIRRVTNYVGATGTFTTDAFLNNVEANDLVCVFHESIMGIEILGFGTLTLSSATIPEDNARLEVDNYFNGCLLMITEGAVRFQPRRIVDWAVGGGGVGTGVFTLDPNNPLTGVPGLSDYIIVSSQTEFIPAVDGTNNRTPSDVIGGKADTLILIPDDVSSMIRYLKGILATVAAVASPTRTLVETWQDLLGIDPTVWVVTNPATGVAWARGENGAFLLATTTPNANETPRLRSVQQWIHLPNTPNLNLIVKKTILEWTMTIGVLANLDNAAAFFGFTNIQAGTRAVNNIIGFGLLADVLQTVTDSGGVETVATGFGEDLTLYNKFRLEIYEGNVDFYLNEVLIANSAVNIPNVPCYINFYPATDGDGACAFTLGIVRCWYEMAERY